MRVKTCSQCKKDKVVSEFAVRRARKDGYCSWCKGCHSVYNRKKYSGSEYFRDKQVARAKARYKKLCDTNWPLMLDYLENHPCVDCGETHPATLEFDHVVGTKTAGVTTLLTTRIWSTVTEEIEKCVVRCANCHSKKTAKERGYYTANGFTEGA